RWCGCSRLSRTTTTCRASRPTWTSRRRSWSGCRRDAPRGGGEGERRAGARDRSGEPADRLGRGRGVRRGLSPRRQRDGRAPARPPCSGRAGRGSAGMIASLAGTLDEKSPERLVVDAGGVGYAVHVSLQTFADLPPAGAAVRLLVHTEVREDAIELFGFLRPEERALFHLLRKVKGLGPRTALEGLAG